MFARWSSTFLTWSLIQAMNCFWKLYSGLPSAEGGALSLGDAPGLGVELRTAAVQQLQIGEATVHA